ncbi:MAG: hypothetical protein EOL98_06995 [Negativicutes bacterium]|nr:hypothetical protein [Negativicutes bacterium]
MGKIKHIQKSNLKEVMTNVSLDSQIRFINNLPTSPRCSNNLEYGTVIQKLDIALCYPFIQMNRHRRQYIVLDIDKEQSAYLWDDLNLPEPTIACVNPITTHCHYFYEIKTPVLFPKSNGDKTNVREKPMRFYDAISRAFTSVLGADAAYTGYIAKNPLHPFWLTKWTNASYDLSYLNDFFNIDYTSYNKTSIDKETAGRNCDIFNSVRKLAYGILTPSITYEEIREFVTSCANTENDYLEIKLPQSEINTIINSISRYCDKNKESISSKYGSNQTLLTKEEVTKRQQKSAKITNEKQKNETYAKILSAIEFLKLKEEKITITAVAKQTEMNRAYLSSKYGKYIKSIL